MATSPKGRDALPPFSVLFDELPTRSPQDGNAANVGDGPKHALLWAVLARLRPPTVVETHAGCGFYRPLRSAFGHSVPSSTLLASAQANTRRRLRVPTGDDDGCALYAGSAALALAAKSSPVLHAFDTSAIAMRRLALASKMLGAESRLSLHPWDFRTPRIGLASVWARLDSKVTLLVADPFTVSHLVQLRGMLREMPTHFLAWWPTDNRLSNERVSWEKSVSNLPAPGLWWRWSERRGRNQRAYTVLAVSPLANEIHASILGEHEAYETVPGYESEGPIVS